MSIEMKIQSKAMFELKKSNAQLFSQEEWVARRIGWFVINASRLERIVNDLVEKRCGISKVRGKVFAQRVDILAASLDDLGDPIRRKRIEEWHSRMKGVVGSRNSIVHGFWCKGFSKDTFLLRQRSDKKHPETNLFPSVSIMDRKDLSDALRILDGTLLSFLQDFDLFR